LREAAAESETDRREAVRLEGELGLLRQERDAYAEQRAKLARDIEQLREQIRREKQRMAWPCGMPGRGEDSGH